VSAKPEAIRGKRAHSPSRSSSRGCPGRQSPQARADAETGVGPASDGTQNKAEFRVRVTSTGSPDQRALAAIGRVLLAALGRLENAERLGDDREEP
jgi:hypothetical protein